MNPGDIGSRTQLTGRLFLGAGVGGALVPIGNLSGHKIEIKREGNTLTKAMKGFHQEFKELTKLVGERFEFDLDEATWRANETFFMALAALTISSGAVVAPSGTATINGVKQGYTYFISATVRDFNTVVVKVSTVAKTVDVDYTIDVATGEIYIIPGGGIADADNLAITYGNAAFKSTTYTPLSSSGPRTGPMRFLEFDQHSGVAFRDHQSTDVQYYIDGGESHDGQKPTTRKLKILCNVIPTVTQREI